MMDPNGPPAQHLRSHRSASRATPSNPMKAEIVRIHRNAPLSHEGRRRLVKRCRTRPIAHVAAEMGISRADAGLQEQHSTPHRSPKATPPWVIAHIETWRRQHQWSAQRITDELANLGFVINRRTVSRHLARVGLGKRKFIDPSGESNRKPGTITARWPGHMVHLDVKKVGRIPDGGGWRVHGRDSDQAKAAEQAKSAGAKRGYVYLHSIVDGFSRLAYTEPLSDEKGATAAAFLARAKVWFAATASTTSTGSSPTTEPAAAPETSPASSTTGPGTRRPSHTHLDTTER